MYQPTLLLETLLHEEKLDKKFISLLLACDEQRAFACQTPTMARETVAAINTRFRANKLRPTDLMILKALVKQCPDEIFIENCVLWISECLKVTGNRKNEENAFDIIRISLEKSSNIQNLTNSISKKVVPRFLDQLLESQKPTYSAIQCLQILFQYYSEPCKAQWKFLQKYLLNFMDEEDQNLIIYASRCLSYLPLIAENGSNQGGSWSNFLSELCVAANSVLHQLFKNVPDIVISPSLGEIAEGIQLKPIDSNDPILLTQQLAQRLINFLIFVEGMLIESCDYIKEIRTDLVITLAYRGLSITYDMLKNSSTMWHVALISVLPNIQTQLFNLLKCLVSCCKGGLMKFGPLFCNIVIKTLKVNFSPRPGMKQYFSKTRKAAYNFLENWILRAKAASCVELFDEELISLLFLDLCQRKYHTSNWVQELFNQNVSYQDHWQEMHIKPISSTCEAALQALCAIALTSGSQLTLSVHKKLQEFVVSRLVEVQQSSGPEDIPKPYNVAGCRLHLYQLLLVLTLHPHPQWSPPINYALSLFSKGQLDSSPEVIKLCTSSMASIHKMVHLSCFSHQSSVENSRILFPFNTTRILNEKANEKQGISQTLTKISKSFKVCRKSQNAFSSRSMKTLKRSLPGLNSDILPKKKRFAEGSVESLDNTQTLQSTDKDWIVKRTSKKQSRKTKPEGSTEEICKSGDLQKTIKRRKRNQISDELKRGLVKYHSLVYSKQDTPEEIALVDLVSDSEIPDSGKILHSNVSCDELITIEDTESSGSENYVSIKEKMEAFTENMVKRSYLGPSNSKEIGAGMKGTEKMTGKDTRNICDIENDNNVGANEEINDAEKIVKEIDKIKKSVIIGKESGPLAALDPEKPCQVQSGKGLLEVNNTFYIIEECGAKIHNDTPHSDNSSQVLPPGMLETKTVEKAQLPTETSFAELSPSNEILIVNQLDTDSFVVNNSIKLTPDPQMLLQSADIEGMSSSQISSISLNTLNETNILEEEHTYVVKSHTDLVKLTNVTLQKDNAQMKVDDGTMDFRVNQDVNRGKICPSGVSNDMIPPVAMEERNNIEIIDEFCTRKQDKLAVNNEKAASLDNSKQESVVFEATSLTVEGQNVTKTVDESSSKKQNGPSSCNNKAASLDESKQEIVSCEEISLSTVEDMNICKTTEESSTGKKVVPAVNNEEAASLEQELDSHEVSLPTLEDNNIFKTVDESSTIKHVAPTVNKEKAASLDESKQELFSSKEISLPTVEDKNVLKTIDESSSRKQEAPVVNKEKAASLDESKQELFSSEEISLPTVEDKNVLKTIDESSSRKQEAPVVNKEKAASLDKSKQELVSHEISLATVKGRNILKTIDKSFIKKPDTSAIINEKAASFDESKQEPVSHEISLQAMEEKNVINTNDETSTRKQDLAAVDNEKAASLNDARRETVSPIESIRKKIEINSTEVNEVRLLDKSNEVRNAQIKSSSGSKGVEPNDLADTRGKGSPAVVNEANIALLADSVKIIDLEGVNDGKNMLHTKAEVLKAGKENTLPESSSVVTQTSNDSKESVKSSVICKDVLSESKESASFLEHGGTLSGQQCIEESQEKEKEQNSCEAVEEVTLKTFVNEISPKSA